MINLFLIKNILELTHVLINHNTNFIIIIYLVKRRVPPFAADIVCHHIAFVGVLIIGKGKAVLGFQADQSTICIGLLH